jgi:pimeloyl-ACP methyl ester carboxylesterase
MPARDAARSGEIPPTSRYIAPASVTTVLTDDGVALSVRRFGPPTQPVIVFVHGFPDDAHLWSGVITALAGSTPADNSTTFERGTAHDGDSTRLAAHLVAYDVRGAGASGAPAGREAYRLERLARDMRDVIDAVSPNAPVHLVGHDWGSIQAFHALATTLSGRVTSFTSISGPHLPHVRAWARRQVRGGPHGWVRLARQVVASAYIGAFMVPGPIDLARRLGVAGRLISRDPSRLGTHVSRADIRHGLKLYRVNLLRRSRARTPAPLHIPVQVIVPTRDRYVHAALQSDLCDWVSDLTVTPIDAGHWLVISDAAAVADSIRRFVARTDKQAPTG